MNERTVAWLRGLSDDEATALYGWLDGNPTAVDLMKQTIADSHPNIPGIRELIGETEETLAI